jgi:iron complex outermembrane receptor protein
MRNSQSLRAGLFATAGFCLIAAAAPPALADAADTTGTAESSVTNVEGVVVTANKRSETLFNVAAPVTAISGETISQFDITDFKTLIGLVPNAELPKSPDNYELYINIRGIQETDNFATPNFGIYRNGIYAGGERPNAGSLIDIDRVEIEAGPQGGLYGRDAVGGAVNVVYATPQSKPGGYLTAGYGNWGTYEIQGAANLPLNDKWAFRVTGWLLGQTDGELYNATLGQYEDRYSRDGGRLQAKFTPNDHLSALWMLEYDDNIGPATEAYAPNGVKNGPVTGAPETPNVIYRDTPDKNWNHQVFASQDIRDQTSFGTFDWVTSFSHYGMHDIEDEDKTALSPTAGPGVLQDALRRREQTTNVYTEVDYFSPEDKPITVTAGVSYFNQIFKFGRSFEFAADLDLLGIPGGLGVQTANFQAPSPGSSILTNSVSAFAQATWKFAPRWSLTAGVRYTYDRDSLNFQQFAVADSPGSPYIIGALSGVFPNLSLVNRYTFTNVSPNAELNFRPTDSLNLYALFSTGFRAGGFNLTTTSVALIPYGSEKAQNYEIGTKTLWFGGRLGMNLDAFYMRQSDLLTYNPDPNAEAAALGFYYLNNVGAADTYGIEYTAIGRITPWWTANVAVGWLNAKIVKGVSYGESEAGQPLENTREWTLDARSNVAYPLQDGYRLLAGVDFQLESGGYLDLTNLPWAESDRLDFTVGVGKGKASLVFYMNNALDSRPPDFVYGDGAETLVDGRSYGVRFSIKY